MIRLFSFAGLLLVAVAVSAQDVEPKYKPKRYKTPEDCFNAVLTAMEKKDFRTMVDAITPDAQKKMAADMALQGLSTRDRMTDSGKDKDKGFPLNEEMKKHAKPLLDAMEKHGLTAKATKDIERGFQASKKSREALLKLLKDPAAFVADVMKAQSSQQPPRDPKNKPKLTDVKIDGNKATANVLVISKVTTFAKDKDGAPRTEERERKQPATFEKIDGGWRIDPQPNRKDAEDLPAKKDGFKDGAKKDKR